MHIQIIQTYLLFVQGQQDTVPCDEDDNKWSRHRIASVRIWTVVAGQLQSLEFNKHVFIPNPQVSEVCHYRLQVERSVL